MRCNWVPYRNRAHLFRSLWCGRQVVGAKASATFIPEVVLRYLLEGVMPLFWISFADADLPKGTQFLGAVVVEACCPLSAVQNSHDLGLNPGGEACLVKIPDEYVRPDAKWINRLLSRADVAEFDEEWKPHGEEI